MWVAAIVLLAGCGREAPFKRESFVFGTRVEVQVWGEPEARAEPAVAAVLQEFDRLHREYHAWQPSQLTKLNDAIAAGQPREVTPELAGLIRDAQAISARGDHLFDPGIGALVKLWGFHDDSFKAQLPDPEKLRALAAARPSIADLAVSGDRVTSRNRSVALDFGGYLKGVALDRAADLLRARGIRNALINIGGNIMVLGSKGGTPWRVGIQRPRADGALATLDLHDGEAIGTSGDYQRYFEVGGRRYCHVIDPRSGAPAMGTQSVSVLIPPGPAAGALSDAASKPLFIAGDAWPQMARQTGIAMALRVDAAGRVEVTPALRKRIKFEDSSLAVEETP